jgi:tetrahydromethanopterin S-methyltransferase subunit B
MSTIIISPDLDVILDAENKVVGEARSDVAVLNIEPLQKKVAELEVLADELVSSLNPKTAPLISSRPRREGVYLRAGFLTNMVIGFLIGLALFGLGALAYLAFKEPSVIKTIAELFKPPT